jgi:hypothetical protein
MENMLENIAYIGISFAIVFFALETAWHFTACKIHDKFNKALLLQTSWLIEIERRERTWEWQVLKAVADLEEGINH